LHSIFHFVIVCKLGLKISIAFHNDEASDESRKVSTERIPYAKRSTSEPR
jgi:hypothetical protein